MWDRCIERSPYGLIYAYSFYLDHVSEHWDALIMGNYEFVMPLTWKRKLGIRYICTPPFIQRLGVFGESLPDPNLIAAFFSEALKHFSYIDADYNFTAGFPHSAVEERTNLVLPLDGPYEDIQSRYLTECKRNIQKAISRKCEFTEHVPVDTVINLYISAYGHYRTKMSKDDYSKLALLAAHVQEKNMLDSCGVIHSETGDLLFGALIFRSHRRLYYLIGAPTSEGRKARAGYFLIDSLLKKYSGLPLTFDFEGSDIVSVADFYRKFGPDREEYYRFRCNHLPWPVKLFKK